MKKLFALGTLCICFVFVIPQVGNAEGIGAFFSYRTLNGDIESDDETITEKYDADMKHVGGGFMYESDVAKDNLLSWRVNLALFKYTHDYTYNASSLGDFSVNGLYTALDCTLGFQLFNADIVRLWLGPTIGGGRSLTYTVENTNGDSVDGTYAEYFFWFGATLGANIHIIEEISLTFVVGYRASFHGSTFKPDGGDKTTYAGSTSGGYINVGFLLRFPGE